jgi:hypothetical protein
VFIIVKIKCVNSNRISNIYDKVTFTTKSNARDITYFTTINLQIDMALM